MMLNFINPSLVAAKSLQGIVEIILRGISIVLSLACIAAASAYFGLLADLCSTVDKIRDTIPNAVVGDCKELKYELITYIGISLQRSARAYGFDKKSAAGWIIFLSIFVLIYQILAFLQLFLHFKLLHIQIPIRKTYWTLFFIIDTVAIAIFALFYFCGATAVAVLGDNDWKAVINKYRGDPHEREYYIAIANRAMKIQPATIAVSVFSFFAMLLYIGAVVYFFMIKLLLKKPTHGAEILLLQDPGGVKADE